MSGLYLHFSGKEARHIPLQLLKPWLARFLCQDSGYFQDNAGKIRVNLLGIGRDSV